MNLLTVHSASLVVYLSDKVINRANYLGCVCLGSHIGTDKQATVHEVFKHKSFPNKFLTKPPTFLQLTDELLYNQLDLLIKDVNEIRS